MGATESVTVQVQQIVSTATMSVMSKISTSSTSTTQQSNLLDVSYSTGTVASGITQKNESNISIAAVQAAAANGSLQSDMKAAIKSAIDQKADTLGLASQKSSADTAITSSVNASITTVSVSALFSSINQSSVIRGVGALNAQLVDIKQTNVATAVNTLTSSVTDSIVAAVKTDGAVATTAAQTLTNPVSDIATALKSVFQSGALVWVLVIIAVIIGGVSILFIFKGTISKVVEKKMDKL